MTVEFTLPDLGENIETADVVGVLVAEGQVIEEGQNVLELETDKAVVELPCPHAGRVLKVHVQPGETVKVGAPVLTLEKADTAEREEAPVERKPPPPSEKEKEDVAQSPPAAEEPEPRSPVEKERLPSVSPAHEEDVVQPPPAAEERPTPAAPATRKLARDLGVDLHQVSGSGPGGRITADDVRAFVRKNMQQRAAGGAVPAGAPALPDFSRWGPVERQPLSGIRRKIAENLSLAWQSIPHVTQFDQADVTELEALRKRSRESRPDAPGKVTMTVLVLKAAVLALKEYPQFNSTLDAAASTLILKKYYHLGVAVDTERGLLVPVLRDADRKSTRELAVELEALAEKARQRKLTVEEMRGGTFTITNLGGIGGTAFSPIVNSPEVAILGVARAKLEPFVREGRLEQRLMMPLSLSYDHRVIDGADGARFLRRVAEVLSEPFRLLLEV